MASDTGPVRVAAGALGPRLLGRLTAELILRSPQYMNPLKQYEIDLRGNKISAIENLGATENQFDSIDLSDNAIVKLEGFPRLHRLKQLLLNNNRIARINKTCHESIPNIDTLILTNNRLSNLQELDPLSGFAHLTMLSLAGNPVATKANYRLYVISKCKKLKVLDFKKVKQQEREEASKLFPTDESAAAAAAATFDPEADLEAAQAAQAPAQAPAAEAAADAGAAADAAKQGPTPEQLVAIKAAIANAATMEEIRRLEQALVTGHLPSEINVDGPKKGQAGDAGVDKQGEVEAGDTVMGEADGDASNKPEDMAVG